MIKPEIQPKSNVQHPTLGKGLVITRVDYPSDTMVRIWWTDMARTMHHNLGSLPSLELAS